MMPVPYPALPPPVGTGSWLVACTVATEVPPDAPDAELRAVIDVIRNRSSRADPVVDPLAAVLAPKQFSGVMRGLSAASLGHRDIWLDAVVGRWQARHVARCLAMWHATWPDTTAGATHYFSPIGMRPQGREPGWAAAMTEVVVPGVRPMYYRFFRPAA